MLERITPAYAGKSSGIVVYPSSFKDHPRLRGEKCFYCGFCRVYSGSPPLTRGKVRV